MSEKLTVERITCPCGHEWTSSHAVGTLSVECPACEREAFTLTDPDEIKSIEAQAAVKPRRGRTAMKKPLEDR